EGFFQYPGILSTWIVIIMKKMFNTSSLFLLRLPFVMFGTISIFLFYKIGKLFNKKVGLISAYLFAFCPLAIGLAGYIRNYEILSFVFVLSLFLILRNKELNKKFFLSLTGVIILLILVNLADYSMWVQSIDLLLLLVIGTYVFSLLLNKFIKHNILNIALKLFFSTIAFFLGRHLIPIIAHLNLKEEPTLQYLFFINYYPTSYLWYFSFISYLIVLLILILPILLNIKNSRIYSLSFSIFFFSYAYIFYFTAPRLFQPRYFYFSIPLTIILLSIGVNYFYNMLSQKTNTKSKSKSKRYGLLIIFITILLLIFSPFNAIHNTLTTENGEINKNNGLAYFDSQTLVNFLIENNLSEKIILTTQPWVFDYYFDSEFLKEKDKEDYVFFPKDQWYEQFDRTEKVWSINGYWSEQDISRVREIIIHKDIEYLVFATFNPEENKPEWVLQNIHDSKLISVIDGDHQYGYYIFKIEKMM
ncbi:MAG: hypothetical protein PHN56_06120, partial [Candidatus Nanoarchaeia archaeon]|nr:hypothetical protein [Candidatus Nanoarchaeia archaeon]